MLSASGPHEGLVKTQITGPTPRVSGAGKFAAQAMQMLPVWKAPVSEPLVYRLEMRRKKKTEGQRN